MIDEDSNLLVTSRQNHIWTLMIDEDSNLLVKSRQNHIWTLMIDEDSNFDNEYENAISNHVMSKGNSSNITGKKRP